MDESGDELVGLLAGPQRHLRGVEGQLGRHRRGGAPPDDAPRVHVAHERAERHMGPGRHVGEVDHPQLVGTRCGEVPLHQVRGASRSPLRAGGDESLVSAGAADVVGAHQPLDLTARHRTQLAMLATCLFSAQLVPNLAGPIQTTPDPRVAMDTANVPENHRVALRSSRQQAALRRIVGGRGDLAAVPGEHPADRLDPEPVPVVIDERCHHGSRGSSSRAKKLDAASRISLARLSVLRLSSTRRWCRELNQLWQALGRT